MEYTSTTKTTTPVHSTSHICEIAKFIRHNGATEGSTILDLDETGFLEEMEREREDKTSFTGKNSKHQDQSIC